MLIRPSAGPSGPNSCAIAVMAKASIPGRAKTRLTPPLAPAAAAELNTAFLRDIAANLAYAGRSAPIAAYMAFGPPGTAGFFETEMPASIGLIETWFPDFGDCLFSAVNALISLGHGAACVLNSDSPTLPTAILIDIAETLLAPGDRAVLGPSIDGGYYALGLKAAHRRLFEDIAWSTDRVAAETRLRAAEIALPLLETPPWYDVDDAASLATLVGETLDGRPFSSGLMSFEAPHAACALRSLSLGSLLRTGTAA